MKTQLTALALATATAFSLAPKSAYAGDKEWAAVGGLIGGLIIGSAIADSRDHHTTVVVRDGPDHCDDGYWKEVRVKVWVDGCWETRYDCGRRVRVYVPGYYTYRTNRVWVAYDRHDRHDYRRVSRHHGHR